MATGSSPVASGFVARRRAALSREDRRTRTTELLARLAEETDPARQVELRNDVVVVNRGVAEAVAGRYLGRGLAEDDLHQVAYEGLVKAVQRFDPTMGHDLLTFAVPTIRGELRRHFRDHGWVVRPPRRIQDLQRRIPQAVDDLGHRLGREPDVTELAAHLDVEPEALAESLAAFGLFAPDSLDRPTADGPQTFGERLADEAASTAQVDAETRALLDPLLRHLSERDRRILHLRYVQDLTQREIGDVLGITQMQVSRLISRILGDLRQLIA